MKFFDAIVHSTFSLLVAASSGFGFFSFYQMLDSLSGTSSLVFNIFLSVTSGILIFATVFMMGVALECRDH